MSSEPKRDLGKSQTPLDEVPEICEAFGYDAFVIQHGKKIPALPTIAALGGNTNWGTEIESRYVLFVPR